MTYDIVHETPEGLRYIMDCLARRQFIHGGGGSGIIEKGYSCEPVGIGYCTHKEVRT